MDRLETEMKPPSRDRICLDPADYRNRLQQSRVLFAQPQLELETMYLEVQVLDWMYSPRFLSETLQRCHYEDPLTLSSQ